MEHSPFSTLELSIINGYEDNVRSSLPVSFDETALSQSQQSGYGHVGVMPPNPNDQISFNPTQTNGPDLMLSPTSNATSTFNEAEAKVMFDRFLSIQPDPKEPFGSHHLVILMKNMKSGTKGTTKVSYKCLWNANKILAIQRNPKGQIYFAMHLDSFTHFSLGTAYFQQLSKVRGDVVEVLSKDVNHQSDMISVWNRDTENCEFIKTTSDLIRKMIPSISKVMKKPMKRDSRGTISMNIGISTNDCGQYRHNRATIFDNIKPFFIKDEKIEEEGKSLLGELVVYVCKHVLPQLKRENHFKLGHLETNTPMDKERQNLRNEFAAKLNVYADDVAFFLIEGVSVIFPLVLLPHKDLRNDWHKYFSGSICINCTVSLSSIQNKSIRDLLKSIGYSVDMSVPCCVILYSRKVCREYFNLRRELSNLRLGRNQDLVRIVVHAILNVRGKRDYIGNIFDATNSVDALNKIWGTTTFISVPSAYDRMSQWSIVLDCIFEYHCNVEKLSTRHLLEYILFIVFDEVSNVDVYTVMRFMLTKNLPSNAIELENGMYRRMILAAKSLGILSKGKFDNITDLESNTLKLLNWCNEVGSFFYTQKCAGKRADAVINKMCLSFLKNLMHIGEDGIDGAIVDVVTGKTIIQLAALFGLIPLRCATWSSVVSAEDQLSKAMSHFNGLSDIEKQRKEFDDLVSVMRRNISVQVTGSIIENILLIHTGENAVATGSRISGGRNTVWFSCFDYYFRHSYGEQNQTKVQNFYRLKFGREWEMQILSDGKNKSLTKWKYRKQSFGTGSHIYWSTVNKDHTLDLESKLMISDDVVQIFLQREKPRCIVPPRSRAEVRHDGALSISSGVSMMVKGTNSKAVSYQKGYSPPTRREEIGPMVVSTELRRTAFRETAQTKSDDSSILISSPSNEHTQRQLIKRGLSRILKREQKKLGVIRALPHGIKRDLARRSTRERKKVMRRNQRENRNRSRSNHYVS